MKPIEKYQEKFIELLKEAEAELGDYLTVKVCSAPRINREQGGYCETGAWGVRESKDYKFELHTNSYVI